IGSAPNSASRRLQLRVAEGRDDLLIELLNYCAWCVFGYGDGVPPVCLIVRHNFTESKIHWGAALISCLMRVSTRSASSRLHSSRWTVALMASWVRMGATCQPSKRATWAQRRQWLARGVRPTRLLPAKEPKKPPAEDQVSSSCGVTTPRLA